MMKRLVFACQTFVPGNGGIGRVDRLLARALIEICKNNRWVLEFHVLSDNHPHKSILTGKTEIYCYAGSKTLFSLGVLRACLRADLIIYDAAYLARVHPFFITRKRAPVIILIHGIEVWESAKPAWINACRKAKLLISNSNYTKERATKVDRCFANAKTCWLATEAGEENTPLYPIERRLSQLNVLMVGRMCKSERYKGHREMINAWRTVRVFINTAKLQIVGQGDDLAAIRQYSIDLGLADSVNFYGFVEEAQLRNLYAGASLFALPSRGEGFGIVYAEAMRDGVPVLASMHDAAQEIIKNGVTGYLADLDDPGSLSAAVVNCLNNLPSRDIVARNARMFWERNLRYRCYEERVREILYRYIDSR